MVVTQRTAAGTSSRYRLSGTPGNDGSDLDDVVGFQHLMLGNELVATDDHRGARQHAQLSQNFTGAPPTADLHFAMLWE